MLVISCFCFFNITGLLADHKLLKYIHIHLGWINTAVLTKWCPLWTGFTALMLYATCTSPIMHLICPPPPPAPPAPPQKIGLTFAFYFSWVLQPSLKRTKFKTMLMQNFGAWGGGGKWGGEIRCIMGDVQVAFSRNKRGRLKYAAGKKMGIIENSFLFTTRENTCLQQISQYKVT